MGSFEPWIAASALIALLPACLADDPPATGHTAQAVSRQPLAVAERKVWNFDGARTAGIDPRFQKLTVKAAKNIAFSYGPSQTITMTATNESDGGQPAQADIALLVAELPANAGEYYKGWLIGTVRDSDNAAVGFCGSGQFEKGEFHAQLQLGFKAGGKANGLCYCNLCPARDGNVVSCTTDQWQVPVSDPPVVSGSGACKAPPGTTDVVVTLEAVAKGDAAVHHRGTAVFQKVVVGRCRNDGTCPDAMTPDTYGK